MSFWSLPGPVSPFSGRIRRYENFLPDQSGFMQTAGDKPEIYQDAVWLFIHPVTFIDLEQMQGGSAGSKELHHVDV